MGQNLSKKQSKFRNLDEVFYCGMTKLRHTRSALRQNNLRRNLSKSIQKFKSIQTQDHDFKLLWFVLIRERY